MHVFVILVITCLVNVKSDAPVQVQDSATTYQQYDLDITATNELTLTATQNKELRVKVKGNITTGYSWYVSMDSNSMTYLKPLNLNKDNSTDNYVVDSGSNGLVGVGGYFYFNFSPLMVGQAKVQFINKRSWEADYLSKIVLNVNVVGSTTLASTSAASKICFNMSFVAAILLLNALE